MFIHKNRASRFDARCAWNERWYSISCLLYWLHAQHAARIGDGRSKASGPCTYIPIYYRIFQTNTFCYHRKLRVQLAKGWGGEGTIKSFGSYDVYSKFIVQTKAVCWSQRRHDRKLRVLPTKTRSKASGHTMYSKLMVQTTHFVEAGEATIESFGSYSKLYYSSNKDSLLKPVKARSKASGLTLYILNH